MDLIKILNKAIDMKASDVHLTADTYPKGRLNGNLINLENNILKDEDTKNFILQLAGNEKFNVVDKYGEIDFSITLGTKARLRINAYKQRGNYALAIRIIPKSIPSFEALNLPLILKDLIKKQNGLILITGPTGSGKSSTLASLLNLINEQRPCHIITLEDPIEYIHTNKKGIVNQREIGNDSESFTTALKAILRQDPDVILIGEMRDINTISIALTAAETGHLVFSTMHTIGAAKTIDRIVDAFPSESQGQIRTQISTTCQAIISQQLIPAIDNNSRIVATEIMLSTPAIKNLIRENKIYQIQNLIQTGLKQGMYTMDQDLSRLYNEGKISREILSDRCNDIDYINKLIN